MAVRPLFRLVYQVLGWSTETIRMFLGTARKELKD
jgi:hypothetical protein